MQFTQDQVDVMLREENRLAREKERVWIIKIIDEVCIHEWENCGGQLKERIKVDDDVVEEKA